jgi:hypothetical protein
MDDSFSGSTLLKNAAFDVILTCCTTMLNVNENMLMDYLMANVNLFDSIVQLLIRCPASHGYDVCLLLSLLLQYHKYDVEQHEQHNEQDLTSVFLDILLRRPTRVLFDFLYSTMK